MNTHSAIKAYTKTGIESGVTAADPHRLTSMLYQGALLSIANAKNAILRKDTPAKGAAISKAIMIIDDGLKASLDKKVGGDLAMNLDALYAYMSTRLLAANLKNDMGALDEVARLLTDLQQAWASIRPNTAVPDNSVHSAPPPKPAANAQLVYGRR